MYIQLYVHIAKPRKTLLVKITLTHTKKNRTRSRASAEKKRQKNKHVQYLKHTNKTKRSLIALCLISHIFCSAATIVVRHTEPIYLRYTTRWWHRPNERMLTHFHSGRPINHACKHNNRLVTGTHRTHSINIHILYNMI